MIHYMLNEKSTIIRLIAGQIKTDIELMSEFFPKPKSLGANVKVELGLSNYATKAYLKNRQVLIHRILLKESDLTNLESDVDKLDIHQLKNVPTNLNNLKSKLDKLDVDKLVSVLLI